MCRDQMTSFVVLALLVLFAFCPKIANAYVFAASDMALFNLRYELSNPAAALIWTDDWLGTAEVNAQDTRSVPDSDGAELLDNTGQVTTFAETDFVFSLADYLVDDGLNIGFSTAAVVEGFTFSGVEIIPIGHQGDGDALTAFDNFFEILGGNPDETVTVTFSLDYSGALEWDADELGFFEAALAGLLELGDVDLAPLATDLFADQHSGTNAAAIIPFGGTLTVSSLLNYQTEYWLYAEAGSEVRATNVVPEPGSFALLVTGAAALLGLRRFYRA